jgi:hypothetical protein
MYARRIDLPDDSGLELAGFADGKILLGATDEVDTVDPTSGTVQKVTDLQGLGLYGVGLRSSL